jgi:GMP synthase-like glutamine amidotransferase
MRICVLEHERGTPAEYFGEWADACGHEWHVLEVPKLREWPEPDGHDVVVSLGSERSVHASPDRWIAAEIEFVRQAHEASLPVLGICFGGQVLAAALGGRVRRAEATHADWRPIATAEPRLIPPGPWFRWHEDVFETPPGARLLAGTADEPLAFALGRSVGLQFHPEVGQELAEAWLGSGREQLTAQGIDPASLREEIRRSAAGARERAFGLFDRIASLW